MPFMGPYVASKFALEAFSDSLCRELQAARDAGKRDPAGSDPDADLRQDRSRRRAGR